MAKKTIAAFICLSIALTQTSLACSGKKHPTSQQKCSNNNELRTGQPVIQPTDELSGSICLPYQYTSETNKSQTLGVLKNKNMIQSNTSDVNPSEDLSGQQQEPIKPAPVKKVQKAKIKKIKKEEVAPQVKNESPVSEVKESKVAPTTAPGDKYQEQQPVVQTPAPMEHQQAKPHAQTQPMTQPPAVENNNAGTQNNNMQGMESKTQNKVENSVGNNSAQLSPPNSVGRILALDFAVSELELAEPQKTSLNQLVDDLQSRPNSMIKIHSFGYAKQGDIIESRRAALQRSIKIRKYLIEKGVNPNDITVNVSDDNSTNKVELSIDQK